MNLSNGASGVGNLYVLHQLSTPGHLTDAVYLAEVTKRGLRHLQSFQAPGTAGLESSIEDLGVVLCADRNLARREWVLEIGDVVAHVLMSRTYINAHLAAASPAELEGAAETLTAALKAGPDTGNQVWVTFWAGDREGRVNSTARRVMMPQWEDIRRDHPAETASALQELTSLDRPAGGSLMVWHGEPGTGKTHAVRALVRAWQDWCAPHFIADPELFLGDASYLLQVLTSSDPERTLDRDWRLLILEDSGELLSADARERTGQALSRLLNATDGLLGQSTNTIVLVTTNEPVGKLHPALTRRGRCLSEIEFDALPAAQANAWLAENGSKVVVTSPTVIANLYANRDGRCERPAERRVGFAA